MWKPTIQVGLQHSRIHFLKLQPWTHVLFSDSAPTCNVINPTISLDQQRYDDRFKAVYSLVDYHTDGDSKSHYVGATKTVVHFVIDLSCVAKISTVNLRNSFNGGAQGGQGRWVALYRLIYEYQFKCRSNLPFRSGKDFRVMVGDTNTGPWKEFASGTFEDPQSYRPNRMVPMVVARRSTPMPGQFVKFECLSWYPGKNGCALQYIGVAQDLI